MYLPPSLEWCGVNDWCIDMGPRGGIGDMGILEGGRGTERGRRRERERERESRRTHSLVELSSRAT